MFQHRALSKIQGPHFLCLLSAN